MIYVGIDVAKDKHDCHIISSNGEILCDNFQFQNSLDGFNSLMDLLTQTVGENLINVKVGLESTGHYSTNLVNYLKRQNLSVFALNPLSVNRFRKSLTLRATKTDKSDARYIAEKMITEDSSSYLDISYHIQSLKSLTRYRYRLIKIVQPLKNRFRRVLHLVFPEFEKIFNVSLLSSYELLEKFPGPSSICGARRSSLEKHLKNISHGRLVRKLDSLIDAAKHSIGSNLDGDIFELKHICSQIIFLSKELKDIESKLKEIMSLINSPITSIPGIGVTMGATILAEIGDINNFDYPEKLQAFAGLAPQIYESGKFKATSTPMDKKGSVYLRNALYQVTKSAYVTSNFMRSYVDRKRAQGKHFYTAMSHGMKKMVRIIFAVLKKNSNFVEPII